MAGGGDDDNINGHGRLEGGSSISSCTTTTTSSRREALLLAAACVLPALTLVSAAPGHAATKSSASPAGEWSSPGLNTPIDPSAPKFFKLSSGVKVQELAVGADPTNTLEAQEGDTVLFDYILRRSNGYFICEWTFIQRP